MHLLLRAFRAYGDRLIGKRLLHGEIVIAALATVMIGRQRSSFIYDHAAPHTPSPHNICNICGMYATPRSRLTRLDYPSPPRDLRKSHYASRQSVTHNRGMLLEKLRELLAIAPSNANEIRMPDALYCPDRSMHFILRPLTMRDEAEWNEVRWRNDAWLSPWESGDPMHGGGLTYAQWIHYLRANEREGVGAVFAMEHDGHIVGQISLGAICYGAMRTGVIGYWVDHAQAGNGFAPMAVCMLADWALASPIGPMLHRLEIAIMPHNKRSLRVVEKIGANHEGLRRGYMYVDGRWHDHETFSLLAEDAGEGFALRYVRVLASARANADNQADTPDFNRQ